MNVAVGSTNPVKISAVEKAFSLVFPKVSLDVSGVDIDSGVSVQPKSNEESLLGARNRAEHTLEKINADFGVGIEGGLENISELWFTRAWMVVHNKKGEEGIGSTISMHVPDAVMKIINQGAELGYANDILFGRKNSKHAEGHFGLMTGNIITREEAYVDGLVCALVRFIHPKFYAGR